MYRDLGSAPAEHSHPHDASILRLQGRHVTLRPIEPNDFAALYSIELAPENIHRWRFRGSTPSPEQYARSLFDGALVSYVVEATSSRDIVGIVTCYDADLKNGVAYIAALSARSHRRNPVSIEGVELLIDYCFANWQFRKLYFDSAEYAFSDFAKGAKALLVLEGRLVQHDYFDGRYWDRHILALYRDSWYRYTSTRGSEPAPATADAFLGLISADLGIGREVLTLATPLHDGQLFDSLGLYMLVMLVEELAGETVLDAVFDQWQTLDDPWTWLAQRLAHRSHATITERVL